MKRPITNVRVGIGAVVSPIDDETVALRAREHLLTLCGLADVWRSLPDSQRRDVHRANHALAGCLQRAAELVAETDRQINAAGQIATGAAQPRAS